MFGMLNNFYENQGIKTEQLPQSNTTQNLIASKHSYNTGYYHSTMNYSSNI